MTTACRSRFLISESALKLSLTPPPSATGTDSLSCTSSASSHSSSSFAVRRKSFRPTSVPNADQPHEARVHSESSSSLVSLGIVLVVSGAQPDPHTRRPLKRPHRAIEREPKERNSDGQAKEQPRYKPPPPDVPLTPRKRARPAKLTRALPLYHPLRPLPPLPPPANSEPSTPAENQHPATRSSGRTRRPPPRNLEHLIVAVSNTARQRQGSPAKKRKVVVIAADEMDIDDAESESGSSKKKNKDLGSTSMELVEEPVEETDSSSGRARRAARRNGEKESATPTPPPQEPPSKTHKASAQSKKPVSTVGRSNPRRVTRRNSDETSSEEKDTAESTPAPMPAPSVPRRTSARRSAGVEHAEGIAVSVRA